MRAVAGDSHCECRVVEEQEDADAGLCCDKAAWTMSFLGRMRLPMEISEPEMGLWC